MNINIQYIVKFWDYLRKLFKPEREGVLLSRGHRILPELSVAKNVFKNNIAHTTNVDLISQYSFDEGSTNVWDNLGTGSRLIRKSFGSSSTAVRQFPEGQSKRSRTAPEQDSKECRTRLEAESNNTRTGVKQKELKLEISDFFLTNLTPTSKFLPLGFDLASGFHRLQCMKSRRIVKQNLSGSRKRGEKRKEKVSKSLLDVANSKLRYFLKGTRYIPAFNPLRALFYLRSSLHRMCTVTLPSLHQEKGGTTAVQVWCSYGENYYKVKRRLKESPNKIRISGFAFFMIFMKNVLAKMVLDVRSVYGLFTNALLKRHQKGTGNVLESYQRATGNSSLAVLRLACARQVWQFSFPCVAQASVMRMLSTSNAWIVRKTVPVYALLTHYQRFIYASSILDPYTESALSKIRGFKRFNFFRQASEWFRINNLSNRLKCFSNQKQGGVRDDVNESFMSRFGKSVFSAVLILMLMMGFGSVSAQAQSKQSYVLQGTVISAVDKKPLQAVSVRIEANNMKTSTKKDGSFSIAISQRTGKVKFTSVGYKPLELDYTSGVSLHVQLYASENQLDEVEVVSTGFQKIPKERATGSFEFVDNKLLNKRVGPNIIDRLENASVSTMFSKDGQFTDRFRYVDVPQYQFNIRGNTKMSGKAGMTIVLDNIVYEGDPRNINPNDIESVTILKDAVAASIWGTSAGEGVIVLTSKKGKYNAPFSLTVNSNFTIVDKPDIYALPFLNSSDFIDYETFLFDKGFYDYKLADIYSYPTLSPVVELLDAVRKKQITQQEADQQISKYRGYDVRDDYHKYVYRKEFSQQYALNLSGGDKAVAYSLSFGHDNNKGRFEVSSFKRNTLRSSLKVKPIKNVEVTADINYSDIKSNDYSLNQPIAYQTLDAGGGGGTWPYLRLVDNDGNPRAIELATYKNIYRDTAGNGKLLDWSYNPIKEQYDNSSIGDAKDLAINLSLRYKLFSKINLEILYAHQSIQNDISDWMGTGSYAMRNMINLYSQWDDEQIINRPIPVGDRLYNIMDRTNSQTGRFQGDYSFLSKNELHKIDLMVGAEVRQRRYTRNSFVMYGYNKENLSHIPVDHVSINPILNQKYGGKAIEDLILPELQVNRYVSFYGNINYAFRKRYVLSGSVRQDASNLFGVKSNNKWQPLWSAGGAWLIQEEPFYDINWLSQLKLRATFGFTGRANASSSGFPILYYRGTDYTTGLPFATISSPSNPSLRWERISTLNLALDFGAFDNRINGSVEWYQRRSMDLLTSVPIDPTTGYDAIMTNGGELDAKGFELTLNSTNLKIGKFSWMSNLLLSRNRTKVAKYYYKYPYPINYSQSSGSSNPIMREGYDRGTLFAFRTAGLDHETGDPIGYEDGVESMDYFKITYGSMDNIHAVGPGIPVIYGSLGNEFNYGNLSLKVNLQARLGYYFFRKSFSDVKAAENRLGHEDYSRRWQKPGDELFTEVPSIRYPLDSYRGDFFDRSEALVEKGDHIRLQDIHLSYQFGKSKYFKSFSMYAFAKNLNVIIWRANKKGIDPEYRDAIPLPLSISLGVNIGI
ncbi:MULTISPECIES: SusC/RagA family TonB-linked outer membrane protein [Sphingobacterium]|uniref:SusC/RagA family TonB-linked outer membrane protein n=1 Tax=Sphingobacterium TaxID=28453 RepID=UPI0010F30EB2|nr:MULTISPECIES: SusC/RagA family TonB-linked outer membrane protein [Sphingobacterium]MCW2263749.1 TonB-linked SusC/RagA family outer membrane protein [Sphingobacterium kitahiroshimense]TCR00628.1 TonB-linked SusC/RagA family outer membrane protein [Sphingobacterium sp. JUb78]